MRTHKLHGYFLLAAFTLIFVFVFAFLPFSNTIYYASDFISDETYENLLVDYNEFGLPIDKNDLNIITLYGADFTKVSFLNAINEASLSIEDDLILIDAPVDSFILDFTSGGLTIDYDSATYGKMFIIGNGSTIPLIKSNLNYAINVLNGDVYFGNLILDCTQTLTTVTQGTDPIIKSNTASFVSKKIVSKYNNLNGYYSVELCIDETENEWMFLTGLNVADIQSLIPSLKTLTIGSSITYDEILDAEKVCCDPEMHIIDTQMCWAAAFSNVLYYTGWTDVDYTKIDFDTLYSYYDDGLESDGYYTREDAIFRYFKEYFTDAGCTYPPISKWYYNGTYTPSSATSSQLDTEGEDWENSGGLFKNFVYDYVFNHRNIAYVPTASLTRASCFSEIEDALRLSSGVPFAVYFYINPNVYTDYGDKSLTQSQGGHAITAWGYTYDADLEYKDGRITSLIITDSDSDEAKTGHDIADSKPNKMQRIDFHWGVINNYMLCYYNENYANKYYMTFRYFSVVKSSALFADESIGNVVNTTKSGIDYYDGETTLYEALMYASVNGLDTVTFDPSLNNQTIEIDREIKLTDMDLTLDASALQDGVTINFTSSVAANSFGYSIEPLFTVSELSSLTLNNVNLTATLQDDNHLLTCIDNSGVLSVINSSISNFKGTYGGAIHNFSSGTATVSNSVIHENHALRGGGGIYNEGTLTLINSSVTDNSAPYQSPVYNEDDQTVNPYGGIYNNGILNLSGKIVISDNYYANDDNNISSNLYSTNDATLFVSDNLTQDSVIYVYSPDAELGDQIATLSSVNVYVPDDTFLIDNSDVLIGATKNLGVYVSKWLTVTYYLNGAVYSSVDIYYNDIPSLDLPAEYTFDGWYLIPDFTSTTEKYIPAEVTENLILYGNLYYDLIYYINDTEIYSERISYNHVPQYLYAPDEGYNFSGWFANADFTEDDSPVVFLPTQVISTVYGRTSLMVFTVTYYVDSQYVNEENVTYGNVPSYQYPTPVNINFFGWYTSDTMTDDAIYNNEPITSNMLLYAYTSVKVFTVTYYVDSQYVNEENVTYGNVPSYQYPTPVNINFFGWYTSDTMTDDVIYNNEPITSNMPLYAYTSVKVFTVTYYVDSQYVNEENVTYGNVPSYQYPTPVSMHFFGWYTSDTMSDNDAYNNVPITSNITLYGRTSIKVFSVTYYVNAEYVNQENVSYGSVPTYEYPTDSNMVFSGWFIANTMNSDELYVDEPITSNIFLYGNTTMKIITVSYTVNGVTKTLPVNSGNSVSINITAPEGYAIEHVYVDGKPADEYYSNGILLLNNVTADTSITTDLTSVQQTQLSTTFIVMIALDVVAVTTIVVLSVLIVKKRKKLR